WRALGLVRAAENTVFVAVANNTGSAYADGRVIAGGSFVAFPDVTLGAACGEEETILRVRLEQARIAEIRQRWPYLGDVSRAAGDRHASEEISGVLTAMLAGNDFHSCQGEAELVVLAAGRTNLRCRRVGGGEIVVFRPSGGVYDQAEGETLRVAIRREWQYGNTTYLSGRVLDSRIDASVLAPVPLAARRLRRGPRGVSAPPRVRPGRRDRRQVPGAARAG
ncbi:MAG: hypothetical protein H5U01_05790, partial [Clostridia bacterium]|nr:hypothetical protein [Clostridia bacterium]